MTRFAHVDGEVVPLEEATVPVRDRGFLYGDAVFETIRVYGERAFAWSRHMDRLENSADLIGLEVDQSRSELRERVQETLEANGLNDAYVRLSVTRGVQPGRLTPARETDPNVVILVEPLPRGGVSGESVWEAAATCRVVDVQRTPNEAVPAAAKTHNYLNGILARLAAGDADVDETLLLDAEGYLTEGATSNVWFVSKNELRTPTDLDRPVLPGITREIVMELATDLGLPVHEGAWTVDHLLDAEEVFLTNTTWEVRPVVDVDGHAFDVGPWTTRLMDTFDRRVESTSYEPVV